MTDDIPTKKPSAGTLIDCDLAGEIIARYMALTAQQLHSAKNAAESSRVIELQQRAKELYSEKLQLGPDRTDLIEKALNVYAKELKSLGQNQNS